MEQEGWRLLNLLISSLTWWLLAPRTLDVGLRQRLRPWPGAMGIDGTLRSWDLVRGHSSLEVCPGKGEGWDPSLFSPSLAFWSESEQFCSVSCSCQDPLLKARKSQLSMEVPKMVLYNERFLFVSSSLEAFDRATESWLAAQSKPDLKQYGDKETLRHWESSWLLTQWCAHRPASYSRLQRLWTASTLALVNNSLLHCGRLWFRETGARGMFLYATN